jgi:hypothetical protein
MLLQVQGGYFTSLMVSLGRPPVDCFSIKSRVENLVGSNGHNVG